MLYYKYIFQVKYAEAILSNSARKLLWFDTTKMLIAVLKNKFIVLFITVFGTLLFPIVCIQTAEADRRGLLDIRCDIASVSLQQQQQQSARWSQSDCSLVCHSAHDEMLTACRRISLRTTGRQIGTALSLFFLCAHSADASCRISTSCYTYPYINFIKIAVLISPQSFLPPHVRTDVCLKLIVVLVACGLGTINKTTKLKTKAKTKIEGHKIKTVSLKTQDQD